jgi:hypothetical protein
MDVAIAHPRDVLGDETYESLAPKGETMTTDGDLRIRPHLPGPTRPERRLGIDELRESRK